MSHQTAKTCFCKTCNKWFSPNGIKNHKKMHRNRRQDCTIRFTHGDTYIYKFSEAEEATQ